MKKSKLSIILCLVMVLVLVCVTGCSNGSVDKKYKYNTEILSNENAPVEGDPDVDAITGFTEDSKQKFVKLPYKLGDTGLELIAIGKYSGVYSEIATNEEVKDALAIVVKNTSDKVVSFSSLTFEIDANRTCSFNPTNLPSQQSALVFTSSSAAEDSVVSYSDVKKFELTDSMAVPSDSLPLLQGVVGVDFKDGQFIVTNLTDEVLGDVYIRYKNCSEGNVYLGGNTCSVWTEDVKAYETKMIESEDFDPETSVIIAVESVKPIA